MVNLLKSQAGWRELKNKGVCEEHTSRISDSSALPLTAQTNLARLSGFGFLASARVKLDDTPLTSAATGAFIRTTGSTVTGRLISTTSTDLRVLPWRL